ncbi:hypothetical protein C8R44DRAFT_755146 [Mycena epipterygia]|nr:hypothetical protein C8R44DRAFT_755146 [Mycena epipterygia]
MSHSTLGCAQNADGSLRDTSQILWYNDVDDEHSITGPPPSSTVSSSCPLAPIFYMCQTCAYRNRHISAGEIAAKQMEELISELVEEGFVERKKVRFMRSNAVERRTEPGEPEPEVQVQVRGNAQTEPKFSPERMLEDNSQERKYAAKKKRVPGPGIREVSRVKPKAQKTRSFQILHVLENDFFSLRPAESSLGLQVPKRHARRWPVGISAGFRPGAGNVRARSATLACAALFLTAIHIHYNVPESASLIAFDIDVSGTEVLDWVLSRNITAMEIEPRSTDEGAISISIVDAGLLAPPFQRRTINGSSTWDVQPETVVEP